MGDFYSVCTKPVRVDRSCLYKTGSLVFQNQGKPFLDRALRPLPRGPSSGLYSLYNPEKCAPEWGPQNRGYLPTPTIIPF